MCDSSICDNMLRLDERGLKFFVMNGESYRIGSAMSCIVYSICILGLQRGVWNGVIFFTSKDILHWAALFLDALCTLFLRVCHVELCIRSYLYSGQ